MLFRVITLFPEIFPGSLGHSLANDALQQGIWEYETINLRDFGIGKHNQVDDTPYGGGAGMVIRADVVGAALEGRRKKEGGRIIYLSPRGTPLTQQETIELAKEKEITLLCGRYEGVDERVLEKYDIEEVSIGDYVLSGGEPAAIVLMDAVIRLLPGVVGNEETHDSESFTDNLLEYPQYTRPESWEGLIVPDILKSGDHAKIEQWRREKSLEITQKRRPDLLVDN